MAKRRKAKTDSPNAPAREDAAAPAREKTAVASGKSSAAHGDRQLVDRCLRGDVAAWEELYEQCHPPLVESVKILLGHGAADPHLIDEIAARIWYALVADDGKLLARFDPDRGAQLTTFLRVLAKDEVSRHFRTEQRRQERELAALRERPRHHLADFNLPVTSLSAFLATLTPHERLFCGEHLLSVPPDSGDNRGEEPTSAAAWQLTHRIHKKLLKFLGDNA